MLSAGIPFGYFLSIMFETTSKCSMRLDFYWFIIAGTAGVAEGLMIAYLVIIMKMRPQIDDDNKKEEKNEADKNMTKV